MTRADLKKLIDSEPPRRIPAEMYADPYLRSTNRIREKSSDRFYADLRALCAKRALTDVQRNKGYQKACRLQDLAREKIRILDERYQQEVWIPFMKEMGILRDVPVKPAKRRVLNRA
jgi:hypothetical protein